MTRGKRRLEYARALLDLDHDANVMARINALPPEDRERLRSQVDFVEEYEAVEREEWPE
jgi:hypothetical protein